MLIGVKRWLSADAIEIYDIVSNLQNYSIHCLTFATENMHLQSTLSITIDFTITMGNASIMTDLHCCCI